MAGPARFIQILKVCAQGRQGPQSAAVVAASLSRRRIARFLMIVETTPYWLFGWGTMPALRLVR